MYLHIYMLHIFMLHIYMSLEAASNNGVLKLFLLTVNAIVPMRY